MLLSLLSQVSSKGAAFEGYSAAIMSNSFGGDVIDMLDMDDVTQLMESMGIATNHKLVLKATFASWKKNPDAAFEALAAAEVAPADGYWEFIHLALSILHTTPLTTFTQSPPPPLHPPSPTPPSASQLPSIPSPPFVIPIVTNVLRLKRIDCRKFEKTNSARCDLRHVFSSPVLLLPPVFLQHLKSSTSLCVALFLLTPQAAIRSRIAGKGSVHVAAESGDVALLKDHLTADPNCVGARDDRYDRTPLRCNLMHFYF
jgi:hypothetical protein